jgi:hypothetical protein
VSCFAEPFTDQIQGKFYLKAGLNAGRAELVKQITQAEPHYRPADALNWTSVKKLQTFLNEDHYLVNGTDKNLGISVVTLARYKKECLKHLTSNVSSESRTRGNVPYNVFNSLIHRLVSTDSGWSKEEKEYLLDSYALTDIPKLHGIPKVHDEPWGLHPVVPSYCLSPVLLQRL